MENPLAMFEGLPLWGKILAGLVILGIILLIWQPWKKNTASTSSVAVTATPDTGIQVPTAPTAPVSTTTVPVAPTAPVSTTTVPVAPTEPTSPTYTAPTAITPTGSTTPSTSTAPAPSGYVTTSLSPAEALIRSTSQWTNRFASTHPETPVGTDSAGDPNFAQANAVYTQELDTAQGIPAGYALMGNGQARKIGISYNSAGQPIDWKTGKVMTPAQVAAAPVL